ncbi:MAG: Fur family transcriptional regulator [Desulfobacteraceae bacterium]|nr:MAG: Fur family transcriptional regulator [Desulfobacteraceae bacterium]
MPALHRGEKEQLQKLFQQEHIDQFEDRYNILEVFLQIEGHVTAAELSRKLKESRFDYGPDFVRDTLKLMCRFGFAQKNRFDNGQVRYEHRHLGQHHDHLICIKCRKILEFTDEAIEQLQVRVASSHGFLMLQHKMELYGICDGCLNSRVDMMPLTMAKQGERLIVCDFTGGTTSRMRLMTMGLRIGDQVEVITNMGEGRLVIASMGKRFVMGRGLAEKVMVRLSISSPEPAEEEE